LLLKAFKFEKLGVSAVNGSWRLLVVAEISN